MDPKATVERNLPAVVQMADIERMAQVVVKSKLFGVETIEQAMTLMLLAQAEGVHPAIAMRDYHIVEGKPALKADAMLARFQAGGGKIEWEEYTDTKVSAYFSHPNSPKPVLIEWSIESANKVKVYNRKNQGWEPITNKHTWKSYPRQMLKARVISEGVRATNPGVSVGIYTPEEVQDFGPNPEKDITPRAGAADRINPEEQERVKQIADKMLEWLSSGSVSDAVAEMDNSALDADQKVYLWGFFDSKQRRLMKDEAERVRAAQAMVARETISEAQHKRLEAIIKERGLDREEIKAWCLKEFGVKHLNDLSREEYDILDKRLPEAAAPAADRTAGTSSPTAAPDAAAPERVIDKEIELRDRANTLKVNKSAFLELFKVASFEKLAAEYYAEATAWLDKKETAK